VWSFKAHDLCREGEVRRSEVSEAQELKQLRDENARLKRLVADLSVDKEMLKFVISKNGLSSQI
jgi:cell division protein FtsB